MENAKTFSSQSDRYARHRPVYPPEVFKYLAGLTDRHALAWDSATGNGQAAIGLAEWFELVFASDISHAQVSQGLTHPRVRYLACASETPPLPAQSLDMIMVAQALHWYDFQQFYPQVERLLRPGGILAAIGYGFFYIQPELDEFIRVTLLDPIDPFWAAGNRLLMAGYRDIHLPYPEIYDNPNFEIQVDWNLDQLCAYLRTWSAVKRIVQEQGRDPVSDLEKALLPAWGNPAMAKIVNMPVFLKVCRKTQ